ncbi:hypothetical protein BZA77DRAFT_293316 [Pyronema omphalodes]|nr:hypothetical protein BZA77DRAFT_293316 [Pyronema omphalodes]
MPSTKARRFNPALPEFSPKRSLKPKPATRPTKVISLPEKPPLLAPLKIVFGEISPLDLTPKKNVEIKTKEEEPTVSISPAYNPRANVFVPKASVSEPCSRLAQPVSSVSHAELPRFRTRSAQPFSTSVDSDDDSTLGSSSKSTPSTPVNQPIEMDTEIVEFNPPAAPHSTPVLKPEQPEFHPNQEMNPLMAYPENMAMGMAFPDFSGGNMNMNMNMNMFPPWVPFPGSFPNTPIDNMSFPPFPIPSMNLPFPPPPLGFIPPPPPPPPQTPTLHSSSYPSFFPGPAIPGFSFTTPAPINPENPHQPFHHTFSVSNTPTAHAALRKDQYFATSGCEDWDREEFHAAWIWFFHLWNYYKNGANIPETVRVKRLEQLAEQKEMMMRWYAELRGFRREVRYKEARELMVHTTLWFGKPGGEGPPVRLR